MNVKKPNSIKKLSLNTKKKLDIFVNKKMENKIFKKFKIKKQFSLSQPKSNYMSKTASIKKFSFINSKTKFKTLENKSKNKVNKFILKSKKLVENQEKSLKDLKKIENYIKKISNLDNIVIKTDRWKKQTNVLDIFKENKNELYFPKKFELFDNKKYVKNTELIKYKNESIKEKNFKPKHSDFYKKKINSLYFEFKNNEIYFQKLRYKRIRIALKNFMLKWVYLQISPSIIYENIVFSSYPFQKENSKIIFYFVKTNNINKVKYYLNINKFLIYDYDNTHNTLLHWSCKRGYNEITKLLLQYKPDIDFINLKKESPLILTLKYKNYYCFKLLWIYRAFPFSTKEYKINKDNLNENLKDIIKFMQFIYFIYQFFPLRIRISKYFEKIHVIKNYFLKFDHLF